MNIIFIGKVYFSYEILSEIINKKRNLPNVSLSVITSKKDNFNSDYKNLIPLCKKNKIKYHLTNNINEIETLDWVKNVNPDLILCCGWSKLLKKPILKIPKYGVIGYHPSELPNNKGRHPLIWAIVLGLKKTASTFFLMDEGADSGMIISQKIIYIRNDNAMGLYRKMISTAKPQVIKILKNIYRNKLKFAVNGVRGNSWRKRKYIDGQVDWRMSAELISNLIKALSYPYPGSHFIYKEKEYKLIDAKIIKLKKYNNIEPGKILYVDKLDRPVVKCGKDAIKIYKMKPILKLKKDNYL